MSAQPRKREQHGYTRSPTYSSWLNMNLRCTKPTAINYERYGGRGITVCDRWKTSFVAFLEDMGERPAGKTLDRIDNNGNYEPNNCKWSTLVEQGQNKRQYKNRGKPLNDLTGKRFGMLTVVSIGDSAHGINWNCNCGCGRQSVHRGDHLSSGRTRSCGCLVGKNSRQMKLIMAALGQQP